MTIAIILTSITLLVLIIVYIFTKHPQFGKAPRPEQLVKIQQSPHYKTGQFHNLEPTPQLTEGYSLISVLSQFLFKASPDGKPKKALPSLITNLHSIPLSEDCLIWFGHSSYFLQFHQCRFLIDPVFSNNASPLPSTNTAFKGTDIYSADDMPMIDYLLITHDHYDHLDYKTVIKLKTKVKHVICGLGVGAHFERWGYNTNQITELDWNQNITLSNAITLYALPARHFSGRGFKRNNTLWLSFLLKSADFTVYLGGDSGFGQHFKSIGDQFKTIDLAILENGQYNNAWHAIHMHPSEVLQAAKDLNAKNVIPVHSCKFKLALHPWKEPLNLVSEKWLTDSTAIALWTPIIGEIVELRNTQTFNKWWIDL